jgi:hypothetical protein
MDEQARRLIDGYIICILVNNLQRISLEFCIFESCQVSGAVCAVKLYILCIFMTDETVLFVYNSYVDLEIISILLGMRESVVDAVSYRIETSNKRFAFRSLWTPSGGARS